MSFRKWGCYNYTDFRWNYDYLYLGAKQKRELWGDFFGHMYSHLRGEYTIFAYEKMWINYIKKINLIERLFSDKRNNFFFITNRLEHMKFLAGYAEKIGGNAVFFERDGQFSRKCGARDSFYTMDKKANQLGARNLMGGGDYARAKSKIFIVLNNNNTDDRFFLWNLATAQLKLLTFSPADTNSLFTSRFLPLFCNNRGFKSWGFYLNLFVKAARLKTATKIVNTCSQYSARPHVVFFSRENHWRPTPNRGHYLRQVNFAAYSKPRATRSYRGRVIQKYKKNLETNPGYFFDKKSGVFRVTSLQHYIKIAPTKFNPFQLYEANKL